MHLMLIKKIVVTGKYDQYNLFNHNLEPIPNHWHCHYTNIP